MLTETACSRQSAFASSDQVEVDHSEKMALLLKRNGKRHQAVIIDGANHSLDRKSDRVLLLTELERFLSRNLPI